jgi:hypothetical protein
VGGVGGRMEARGHGGGAGAMTETEGTRKLGDGETRTGGVARRRGEGGHEGHGARRQRV